MEMCQEVGDGNSDGDGDGNSDGVDIRRWLYASHTSPMTKAKAKAKAKVL